MTTRPSKRGSCTFPHQHQPTPPPADPPPSTAGGTLLRELFAAQEKAIRDLALQVATAANRVVGVETKVGELRDEIGSISARLAAPPAADVAAAYAAPAALRQQ